MPHQKYCNRLCVASYCSDPSGDYVGPLVGVLKAACSVLTTASDVTEINETVVVGVATAHWLFNITVLSNQGRSLRCVGEP